MAQDGTPNQPTIPAYMVSLTTGRPRSTAVGGSATTITPRRPTSRTLATSNIMAGFSSQGPTDVDFRVKPDVVAPGVNVLSSIPGQPSRAPRLRSVLGVLPGHVDGDAASGGFGRRRARAASRLAGWAVRSAIVNTADEDVLQTTTARP